MDNQERMEYIKKEFRTFRQSKQNSLDNTKFAVAVCFVMERGLGLSWEQLQNAFDEVINSESINKKQKDAEESLAVRQFKVFCQVYHVNSAESYKNALIPFINNMSDYCHYLNFNDRHKYREIKHKFLKFMYINGMVKTMTKEISKSPLGKGRTDELIRLEIGDCIFHVPNRNQDFVDINTLPLFPKIYFGGDKVDLNDINFSFNQYLDMLHSMSDEKMLKQFGIQMKGC